MFVPFAVTLRMAAIVSTPPRCVPGGSVTQIARLGLKSNPNAVKGYGQR